MPQTPSACSGWHKGGRLRMVTLKEAKRLTKEIVKTIKPLSVILFGSVARCGEGEDLDLLIITEKVKRGDEYRLHKSLKKYYKSFSVDPFILSVPIVREYYLKGSAFLHLILREGRPLYMKNMIGEWLRQSQEEFEMAQYLFEGGYFKGACFHSQQSVEKAIKALLLKKGWVLEKTHNIGRLVAIARDYRVRINITDEEIVFIDSIYRGRYPAEAGLLPSGEPDQREAKRPSR
jgi:HEPN domain-containing protein/predicted nucleotidyltransferase